jgi:membrane protein
MSPSRRGRLWSLVVELGHEWKRDRVPDLAAEVAFYAILSLLPTLLAVAALLGQLGSIFGQELATDVQDEVVTFLRTILTSEADETITAVTELFTEKRTGLLTVSVLTALWAVSRAFAALIRALDIVYDVDDLRPWLRTRLLALGLALGSIVAGAVMLTVIVIGPLFGTGEQIAAEVGLGDQFAVAWNVFRLPVAFVLLVAWAAAVFHLAPAHHTAWRDDLPGAVVTGVLWVLFSAGLRLYVEIAEQGNAVFGALGGVLIVLLWFWLLSLAVMIGGEVNHVLLARRSHPVESIAERAHELAGLDRAPAVEEDAHDR